MLDRDPGRLLIPCEDCTEMLYTSNTMCELGKYINQSIMLVPLGGRAMRKDESGKLTDVGDVGGSKGITRANCTPIPHE